MSADFLKPAEDQTDPEGLKAIFVRTVKKEVMLFEMVGPSSGRGRVSPKSRRGKECTSVGVRLEEFFHVGWLVKP